MVALASTKSSSSFPFGKLWKFSQDGELKDVQSDIDYKVNLGYYKLHNEEVYRRSDVSLMELEWIAETYE